MTVTLDLENVGRNARRWEVKAHIDDNVCKPCKDNDGKVYRNRQAAYRDYPDNNGYRKCVGAKYGNNCRCRVVKRGKGENKNMGGRDLANLIERARALTAGMSAHAFRSLPPVDLGLAPMDALRVVKSAPPVDKGADENGWQLVGPPTNASNAIYIYNAIGGWDGIRALDVAMALTEMTGPVDVHLNSPGGFIFEGTAIFNAFQAYTGGPVTMYNDGYAASAASFIMMAASPYDPETNTGGIRVAKNALTMIHDGQGGAIGTAEDLRDVADLLDMLSDVIAETYADRAGGDAATWRERMQEGDTWYDSTQAKAEGLADVIIGADAPAEPEPDEGEDGKTEEESNVVVIDLFKATATFPALAPAALADPAERFLVPINGTGIITAVPKSDDKPTPEIDIEGLRNALKGAFK